MKIMLVVGMLVLAGCASSPHRPTIERQNVASLQRALGESGSDRARELALHALSQIGVHYRYGGSTPEDGFDCSGLVHYVYSRAADIALPRTTLGLSTVGAPVEAMALEPGDLVFFDILHKPFSHVGIYLGDHRFIHAPSIGGTVGLVDIRSPYWNSRFSGARRISF